MKHNWKNIKLSDVLELNVDAVEIEPTTLYKFAGVFSFAPRISLIVGIALIGLSLVAFYAEELGKRKQG